MRTRILSILFSLVLLAAPALAFDKSMGPVNTGTAQGDGLADDTAALQQVLDRGETVVLATGKTYRITRRLDIRHDGGGILGDGSATLLMESAPGAFDNEVPERRYQANAVGVMADGIAAPRLEGVRIVYKGMVDERIVKAVAFRRCSAISIRGNDLSGFSKADGIIYVGASTGGVIARNHIHDSSTNSATRGQISGIVTDDDDQASSDLRINGNDIHDLTVGDRFKAQFGVQTDGINTTARSVNLTIARNRIRNVGEGIDTFAKGGRIEANEISNAREYGIKLMHGAAGITVSGNVIRQSGRGGIVLAGSNQDLGDTAENVISGNVITGVDGNGEHGDTATFGIGIIGSPTFVTTVRNSRIEKNVIDLQGTAKFGIVTQQGQGRDNIVAGNRVKGWGKAAYRLDPVSVPAGAQ